MNTPHRRHLRSLLLAIALIAACFRGALAGEVHDQALGLTITIPDGFQPDATVAASDPNFVLAFRRPKSGSATLDTIIIIERLRGVIGRERMDPSKFPKSFKGKLFLTKWNGFDIEGFEVPESLGGVAVMNFNIQVPLKPRAIQLRVFGPAADAAELRQLSDALLQSLRGQSNWIPSSAPAALASSPAYRPALLAIAIVAILLGVVIFWFIGRRLPGATVLLLGVLLYGASWALPREGTREVHLAVGILRMLGVCAVIIWTVQLIWRPRTKQPPAAGT